MSFQISSQVNTQNHNPFHLRSSALSTGPNLSIGKPEDLNDKLKAIIDRIEKLIPQWVEQMGKHSLSEIKNIICVLNLVETKEISQELKERSIAVISRLLVQKYDETISVLLKECAIKSSNARNTKISVMIYENIAVANPVAKRTPLHYACEQNDIFAVRRLLYRSKGDLYQKDSKGYQPVHLAIKHGHLKIVQEILDNLDEEFEPYPDLSDLVSSCVAGESCVLLCFIEFANYCSGQTNSSSSSTSSFDQTELAKMLQGTASLEKSLLHLAVENNQSQIASILIKLAKHAIDVQDYRGRRPLEIFMEKNASALKGPSADSSAALLLHSLKPIDWTLMQTACLWGIECLARQVIRDVPVLREKRVRYAVDPENETSFNHMTSPAEVVNQYKHVLSGRVQGENCFHLLPEGEAGQKIADGILEEIKLNSSAFISVNIFLDLMPPHRFGVDNALLKKWVSPRNCVKLNMCDYDDETFLRILNAVAIIEGRPREAIFEVFVVQILKSLTPCSANKFGKDRYSQLLISKYRLLLNNGMDLNRAFEVFFRSSTPKMKYEFYKNGSLLKILKSNGWLSDQYAVCDDVIFNKVEVIRQLVSLSKNAEAVSKKLKNLWGRQDCFVNYYEPVCLVKTPGKLLLQYQLLPNTTKKISLWDHDPDEWEALLKTVEAEVKESVSEYAKLYDQVIRLSEEGPAEGDVFRFRKSKKTTFPIGEHSGCIFDAEYGIAVFYSGRILRQFSVAHVNLLMNHLSQEDRFVGFTKTVSCPVGLLLKEKADFIQECNRINGSHEELELNRLKKLRSKIYYVYASDDFNTLKDIINNLVPQYNPFFSGIDDYAKSNTYKLLFTRVDIIAQTLSMSIVAADFKLEIHNLSFWRLREKMALVHSWLYAVAEGYWNSELAYRLTETPFEELKVNRDLNVDIKQLKVIFLECKQRKPDLSKSTKGVDELIQKLTVPQDIGQADQGLLSESRLLAMQLIEQFDTLNEHEKTVILQELGRCGSLCIPEIKKTLSDVVRRYIFKITETSEAIASKRLLARSLDIAKRRSFYNLVSIAYPNATEEPDTHFLTHLVNLITAEPNPIELPSDLMAHANRNDFYNTQISDLLNMDNAEVKMLFCENLLSHLGPTFVHQYEEMSKSDQKIDRESMLAVLVDLQNAALKASSQEKQAEFTQLQESLSKEYDKKIAQLKALQVRLQQLNLTYFKKVIEYRNVKKGIAALAKIEMTQNNDETIPEGSQKRRRAHDDTALVNPSRRRKLNTSPLEDGHLSVREGSDQIRYQLETKISGLEEELKEFLELEKSVETLTRDIEQTAHQNDLKLSNFKQQLLDDMKWILDEFDFEDQLKAEHQIEAVKMPEGVAPPYTLTQEGLTHLMVETGALGEKHYL